MDSLPASIHADILSRVAATSITDFGNARIAFPGFNVVAREDLFYRNARLIFMNHVPGEELALRTYEKRCYNAGNPEAIYLRGISDYFLLHFVDEGREKIRLAGERGCELANYVSKMLNLVYSVDDDGFVHDFPDFDRDYVYQMCEKLGDLGANWIYARPEEFVSLWRRINPNTRLTCPCSTSIEALLLRTLYGDGGTRACDRCFWQYESWGFCCDLPLTARYWPNG